MYTAAVITVSDKGYAGQRQDTGGPLTAQLLTEAGYDVVHTALVSDDMEMIKSELIRCADELDIALVVTTGGTGFSPRDNTPEATLAVCGRMVPGIPEAMRAESMKITPHGMLSRAQAGIRGGSLVINLPGSPKALKENLMAVIPALRHGLDTLRGPKQDCAVEMPGDAHHHGV